MKKILLSAIVIASLFASNTNIKVEKDINTTVKSNIKKTINNENISMQQMLALAQKHFNYVLSYKDFLKKLSHKELDPKKPVLLVIGTPDCKWTKKEMIDMLGYPPLWEEIKNNFTVVYVNLLKDKLPSVFLVSITPTIYVLSPITGNILTDKPIAGYVDKNEFVSYLKTLKKAWNMYLEKLKTKKNTVKKGR